MSGNCILAWSAYVVLSFILSVCINAHCDTVPSSYILVHERGSISTVHTVVSHQLVTYDWHQVSTQMNKMCLHQTDFCKWSDVTIQSRMERLHHEPKCVLIFRAAMINQLIDTFSFVKLTASYFDNGLVESKLSVSTFWNVNIFWFLYFSTTVIWIAQSCGKKL